MTRIAENTLAHGLLVELTSNRERLNKYSNEVASGLKVVDPGDSRFSGTISQYRNLLQRLEGDKTRAEAVKGTLGFQDNIMTQVSDLLVRAQEIATQGSNETLGTPTRAQLAVQVFDLRDQLVTFANSKYQDRYVFAGKDDDDAPFGAQTYTNATTSAAGQRWVYDDTSTEPDNGQSRSVNITANVSVVTNQPGNAIFSNALAALERLGRALEGYRTTPASGTPDGGGTAYNMPTDIHEQTRDIQGTIDLLNNARANEIEPVRVSIGARLTRLDAASSLIDVSQTDAQTVLNKLQNADTAESATNLSEAENALQASYTVTSRILSLNILSYL